MALFVSSENIFLHSKSIHVGFYPIYLFCPIHYYYVQKNKAYLMENWMKGLVD
jgi:hypothetical protein